MTLHISEAEVRAVLTMPLAVEAVEEISRKQATGEVVVHPRRRFELPGGGFFHYMAAADFSSGFVAMKQYTFVRGKLRFLVPLYQMATGDLLALIEADYMGQLRTGAASGVATKYLARKEARVAAIIGTGGQARTQLEAVAAVRKLESARAYGRDAAKREKFCKEMSERLGIPVLSAASAGEAARGADIVSTATRSGPTMHTSANSMTKPWPARTSSLSIPSSSRARKQATSSLRFTATRFAGQALESCPMWSQAKPVEGPAMPR